MLVVHEVCLQFDEMNRIFFSICPVLMRLFTRMQAVLSVVFVIKLSKQNTIWKDMREVIR